LLAPQGADAPRSPARLFAARFTPGVDGIHQTEVSVWYALLEVLDEVCKSFHYVIWLPTLVACFWLRRRLWTEPALALPVLLGLLHLLLLWRLAVVNQYVSERHTLTLVLCGCIFAVAALFAGAEWCATRRTGWRFTTASFLRSRALQPSGILLLALILLASWATSRTLRPLHPHRAGHKEAGLWLARHARPTDRLVDPYGWVSFYAGRTLGLAKAATRTAASTRPMRYVVVEPKDRDTTRLGLITTATAATGLGEPVFTWPPGRPAEMVVYKSQVKRRPT
jgi:hypothetical protein